MKLSYIKIIIPVIFLSLLTLPSCKDEENKASAQGLGDNFLDILSPYPIYQLYGTLNLDYTQSCGTVTQSSGTTSGTTGTTTSTIYNISSYYIIDVGATEYTLNLPIGVAVINTRFKYDSRNDKYTLSPLITSLTCNTTDYINCNTTGTFICDTVDNIKCGGTETFIFTSKNIYDVPNPYGLAGYSVVFQAYTGTIDWSNGFVLTYDNTQINYADLKFSMVGKDNSVFSGRIICNRPY